MTTCDRFAAILKGEKETDAPKGVCFVTRMRNDLPVKILGRRTRSKVVFYMSFSFENVDSNGNALCFGEFVFRQTEVKPFLDALTRHGITTTALHNHWLKESPRLIYIHWGSNNAAAAVCQNLRERFRSRRGEVNNMIEGDGTWDCPPYFFCLPLIEIHPC